MPALEDLSKNRAIVWNDLIQELRDEIGTMDDGEDMAALEKDLDVLYREVIMGGVLYPAGFDRRHRAIWRAHDYKAAEFLIREFLSRRRMALKKDVENVRIQSGLPKSS